MKGIYDGAPSWGFFVYRTAYTGQGVWERCLSYLRNAVMISIWRESDKAKSIFEFILKQGLALDGRALEEVREIFSPWVAALLGSRKFRDLSWSYYCGEWYLLYMVLVGYDEPLTPQIICDVIINRGILNYK
ncbi:hypothetical protein F5Y06DRAFT_191457 [Hypoxylon sp. FL0890]|nr:hypothetical protein F5Y06DRAFT_191457 [Hypoxylon sp. FL0890]